MTNLHPKPRRTFAELYCEQRAIPKKRFARQVLKETLCAPARVLYPLVKRVSPDPFEADLALVRSVGARRSMEGFEVDVVRFMWHPANSGILRELLNLRISVGSLRDLMHRTLDTEQQRL